MSTHSFDSFIKTASDWAAQVKVSSALSSLLWALIPLVTALVVTSFGGSSEVQTFLMWVIGTDMAVFLVSFIGILLCGISVKSELLNLLRSEEHTYRMKQLERLGDERGEYKVLSDATVETNPDKPILEPQDNTTAIEVQEPPSTHE